AIALTTFLAGYVTIGLLTHFLLEDVGTRPMRLGIAGFAAGVPITAIVLAFNHLLFGDPLGAAGDIIGFYISCSLIAAALSLPFCLVDMRAPAEAPEITPAPESESVTERPAILDRLPAHLRGRL